MSIVLEMLLYLKDLRKLTLYWWLSARLQYVQSVSNGDTSVLHWAIDIETGITDTHLPYVTGMVFTIHVNFLPFLRTYTVFKTTFLFTDLALVVAMVLALPRALTPRPHPSCPSPADHHSEVSRAWPHCYQTGPGGSMDCDSAEITLLYSNACTCVKFCVMWKGSHVFTSFLIFSVRNHSPYIGLYMLQ